jgi:hypothetical protein
MTRAEKRAANKAAHVNLGRGHNKGSGIPARGLPATGLGWGGPAKGDPGPLFDSQYAKAMSEMAKNPEVRARNEARAEELREFYYQTAKNENEPTLIRMAAADKYLDRVEGKPIARSVTTTVDDVSELSDIELAAEIARLEREIAQCTAGTSEAPAGEPAGGVSPLH